MALTRVFTIEPNPHWVVIDNFSKLPNGAVIYTYRQLDPQTFKPAYQDASGTTPYSQPIIGNANGTFPPIYWEFDPNNPDDTYYIQVWSARKENNGVLLWDFQGLSGGGAAGGGTVVSVKNIKNLTVNNIFYRNIGNQTGTPSLPTFLTIAPSNNAGFVGNAGLLGNGSPAPDITFQKNNTTATDNLHFVNFTPLGINDLAPDITPQLYVSYICSVAGAGETYKYIQFPLEQSIQTLSQQMVRVKIYAQCTGGNTTLKLFFKTFYGDGGGSGETIDQIGPDINLTPNWNGYSVSAQVPNVTGGTIGACGNDGLFLLIGFPLDAITTMNIIKPSIYLGNDAPQVDFVSNDEVNAVVNSPRTGDIRTSLNNFIPGWVLMDDGTIGDATSNATSRANIDTYPLFNLIWNNFKTVNEAFAPMFTAAGAPIAYGATPIADFIANRQISLTRNLGRVMAGALPVDVSQAFTNVGNVMTVISTASFNTGVPVRVTGGGLPTPLVAGTTYYAIKLSPTTMSLATTPENAIAGTVLPLTSNAAGNVIVAAHSLGQFVGEERHTQTIAELAAHNHPLPGGRSYVSLIGGTFASPGAGGTFTSDFAPTTGSSTPFNVMQPTVYMNIFIKL